MSGLDAERVVQVTSSVLKGKKKMMRMISVEHLPQQIPPPVLSLHA